MQWWEIYVQSPESLSEIVSEYLVQLGSSAVVVHETAKLRPQDDVCIIITPEAVGWVVLQGAFPADESLHIHIESLQYWLQQLARRNASPPFALSYRLLQHTDYLTQWQHFFQPILIGERLLIRPPWETDAVDPDIACLTLEPGLAFGTGTHPTTYRCLELLTEHLPAMRGPHVLDVGCGSGILSLAALKLGARAAVGVDIDSQAIAVARRNAEFNDLQHCVRFAHGSWDVTEGLFDIIMANIYLGPLLQMIPPLAQRLAPHGFLLVSGILETQEEAVVQAFGAAGLCLRQRAAEDAWVTLMAEHAGAGEA